MKFMGLTLAILNQRLTSKSPVANEDSVPEGTPAVLEFYRLPEEVFGILKIDATFKFLLNLSIPQSTESSQNTLRDIRKNSLFPA